MQRILVGHPSRIQRLIGHLESQLSTVSGENVDRIRRDLERWQIKKVLFESCISAEQIYKVFWDELTPLGFGINLAQQVITERWDCLPDSIRQVMRRYKLVIKEFIEVLGYKVETNKTFEAFAYKVMQIWLANYILNLIPTEVEIETAIEA
jgi:hypothetical protein